MKNPQKLFFSVAILFIAFMSQAQAPAEFNYQAIARNTSTGAELSETSIYLIAKIRKNGPVGSLVFQEEHDDVRTNQFGLFSISIGGGSALSETPLSGIDWSNGSYWLEIEIDIGQGLQTVSSMQLISVPYAMHAQTVSDKDDADADPMNETITDFLVTDAGDLTISEAGESYSLTLPDNDPKNELISSMTFNEQNGLLTIAEGDSIWLADISAFLEVAITDEDTDPENELVNSFSVLGDSLVMIQNGTGTTFKIALSELALFDGDADSSNELVNIFEIEGNDLVLKQNGEGQNFAIPLTDLWVGPNDVDPENEIQDLQLIGDSLSITNKVNPVIVNLSNYIDDADADDQNELVNDLTFNESTRELTLSQNGPNKSVNIPADADADTTNERISNISLNSAYTLELYENGSLSASQDLSILKNDGDFDATNELVQSLILNSISKQLTLVQPGPDRTVDLSPIIPETYWSNNANDVYNLSDDIGIGTSSPDTKLDIKSSGSGDIVRVRNSLNQTVLDIGPQRIGLGGSQGENTIQHQGSVGYNTRVLNSGVYTVTEYDYFIVRSPFATNSTTVIMPLAEDCKGRMLLFKKLSGPNLILQFNGQDVDFTPTNGVFIANAIGFMSLGDEGWLRFY